MKRITLTLIIIIFIQTLKAQVFSESFEGGSIPVGWTQQQQGTSAIWFNTSASFLGASPQDGDKCVGYWGDAGFSTRLITPAINLSVSGNDSLSFYYTLKAGASIDLYYKTSLNGVWTPLTTINTTTTTWKEKKIFLPNITTAYYIAFQGTSVGSYDMNLDNINIYNYGTTTVQSLKEKTSFVIGPNPNTGAFQLKSSEIISSVNIYNVLGELVYTNNSESKIFNINLLNQPDGVFFLKLKSFDGQVELQKIIKK